MDFPRGGAENDLNRSSGDLFDNFEHELEHMFDLLRDALGGSVEDESIGTMAEDLGWGGIGLASMGDLGYAAVAFAMLWVSQWVLDKFGRRLTGISVFGFHPFGFIEHLMDDIESDIQGAIDDTLGRVTRFLIGTFGRIIRFFARAVNLVDHFQGYFHDITSNRIPEARNAAQHYARGIATDQANQIREAVSLATLQWDANHSLAAAEMYARRGEGGPALAQDLLQAYGTSLIAADNHADYDLQLARNYADDDTASERQRAENALAKVVTDTDNTLRYQQSEISANATMISTTIPQEIATAAQQTYERSQANLVTTARMLQGELNSLQGEIDTANANIAAANVAIADNLTRIDDLRSEVHVDESAIRSAQAQINVAQATIATNEQTISDLRGQQTKTAQQLSTFQAQQTLTNANLGTTITSDAAVLSTAVAGVAAGVTSVATKLDQCAVTTCAGPNNINNVLKDIMGVFDMASIVAFLTEAATNPVATAKDVSDLAEHTYSLGHDALDALLSL